MGAYGLGPFSPSPYPNYPANVMAAQAQMNQMQLSSGFGYGGYGNAYGGAAGFNPNAQAAGLPRPQQGQPTEGFEQQQPAGEGFSQTSPGSRFPSFPG